MRSSRPSASSRLENASYQPPHPEARNRKPETRNPVHTLIVSVSRNVFVLLNLEMRDRQVHAPHDEPASLQCQSPTVEVPKGGGLQKRRCGGAQKLVLLRVAAGSVQWQVLKSGGPPKWRSGSPPVRRRMHAPSLLLYYSRCRPSSVVLRDAPTLPCAAGP